MDNFFQSVLVDDPAGVFWAGLIVIAIAIAWFLLTGRSSLRHQQKRRLAVKVYKRLIDIAPGAARMVYLRKVDPYAFEELILDALQRRGHKIVRNVRYTGDGGIDGRFFYNGHQFLIQAKRYSGHINSRHVQVLEELCRSQDSYGLFVHTGRTGRQSKSCNYEKVTVVSGDLLLKLLVTSEPLRLQLNSMHYIDL